MQVLTGSFESSTPRLPSGYAGIHLEWPHAFARFDAPADEILARFGANHIHAVPGDHVDELRALCRLLDVDFDRFGASP